MIYAIRAGRRVKIGFSTSPWKRFMVLKTACADTCTLLGTMPGERADEAMLHSRFRQARVNGEWFEFTDDISRWAAENLVPFAVPRKARGGRRPGAGRPPAADGAMPMRSIRVSDADWQRWQREAAAAGKSLTQWLRDRAQ